MRVYGTRDKIDLFSEAQSIYFRMEYPVNSCIPDILYVGFRSTTSNENWPTKWSYLHSSILSLLRHKDKLTVNELSNSIFEDPKRIQPIIQNLETSELIIEDEYGYLSLSNELMHLSGEIIAIELKLFRWEEALNQAINYLSFSNKAIVAMDIESLPDDITPFQENGIGLFGVSEDDIVWKIKPKYHEVSNFNWEYIINSVFIPTRQKGWESIKY